MIIGLTGRIAAGKGILVEYFRDIGFKYCTISDVVREEAEKQGIEIEKSKLQDIGNEIRNKEGAGAWMIRLLKKVEPNKNYIIDGIRNPGEITELRKIKNTFVIAMYAPQGIRFERLIRRARASDPQTWEDFVIVDKRDLGEEDPLGQQVGKCMDLADFHVDNDGTLEECRQRVTEIWQKIQEKVGSDK